MSSIPLGTPEFSRWRRYLWPVYYHELKKLIPMLLIFFFVSFDYNILRTLKDSLLVTAKSAGAEVIPFVKVWGVFPGAVLMTLFFAWLSNHYSKEKVFYILISLFLLYFFIFTFFLYPIRDSIHPHELADRLEQILPPGFRGLVAMFRYWTFTIFYVASELWSSAVLSVLFWGFANQVTKIHEARRFYGLFGVGANISGIVAGQASVFCCTFHTKNEILFVGEDCWHQSLIFMISFVLVSGILSLFLFKWLNDYVLRDKRYYDPSHSKKEDKIRGKISLKESIQYLLNSSYLLCIAAVVICYNLIINLTEILWKQQVVKLYPNPVDYTVYMNHIVSIIGVVATLVSLFVSGNAIRKGGWTFTALLTPIILALTSIAFFGFFFLNQLIPDLIFSVMGISPLVIVVFLGSAQNILSRGAKYSVFDSTKEMTFVPLSPEKKLIGKAVIDGICSRLGKSSGSVVYQSLLLFLSTIPATAPYVAVILLCIIITWVLAVRVLGKQFNELTQPEKNDPIKENGTSNEIGSLFSSIPPSFMDSPVQEKGEILSSALSPITVLKDHPLFTEQKAI